MLLLSLVYHLSYVLTDELASFSLMGCVKYYSQLLSLPGGSSALGRNELDVAGL